MKENVTVAFMFQPKIKVVCLCGSTRFKDEFMRWNRLLTLNGEIVLMPGVFGHSGDPLTERQKERLDQLHLQKIIRSDYVVVIDVGGYIGESTSREIDFAERCGIPVYYISKMEESK